MKIQCIYTIIQRINQFISKYVDFKKTVAIAVAVWMLHGIPIPIHADWDQFWENVNAEWELLKPNKNKDFTYSFNYLVLEVGNSWRVMQLAYLGKSNDEHLFIGARAFIMLNGDMVIDQAINTLVGRDGVIKKNIVEITEHKHIPHPEKAFYDLTILAIKDVDMDDYKPIATSFYPDVDTDLEMYSLIVNTENALDFHNYPFGKRLCQAGHFDAERGLGFNSCLIQPTPAVLGAPIVDANTKRLVAMYVDHEHHGNDVFNLTAISVPVKLGGWGIEGYAVKADDKIATTWSNIKKDILHK